MEFRLLGPLEVRDGGRRLALGAGRQRALLAILLLHANEVVASDRLAEELWAGRPPGSARKAVQVYVFRLRRALGDERIRTQPSGYLLAVGPEELDVHRFERLVREAGALRAGGENARAAAALQEALALWDGPALADFTYEQFAQTEIARLEELRLVALEQRIDADLRAGQGVDLVGELEALVAEHPYRELLRGQLMLALYRAGRQVEALAAYQQTRRLFVDELGIEPSPSLQRLESAILRQEPELEPSALAAPTPGPSEPPREVRKTVTVAAFDILQAGGLLDPEVRWRLRRSLATPVSDTCSRHGGQMAGTGESLIAVFGIPAVHEDDALRAVRAAAEVRARELPLRVGIDTGDVLVGGEGGEDLLTTQVAESAMRLRDTAAENEILLGEATRRLLGASARVAPVASAWRLLELVPGPPHVVEAPEAPLIGREEELAQLGGILGRMRRERTSHLVTVFGQAGIGKSRLARELVSLVGAEATVLTGRCLPYGEGITFWPLREIVEAAAGEVTREGVLELLAGADDARLVADRLAAVLGLAEAGASEEEIFWAVRRLLETLAAERSLVVVLEDLHWAEATFLDLVEYLAEWAREAPLLLLCLARPELLESRPRWAGGTPNAVSLGLEPLGRGESQTLIDGLPGGARLAEETRMRLLDAGEGNPLFLEQLLALVREEGGRLGEELPVPATIAALLAARLDRLGPAERAVLEAAAVVGNDFSPDALLELLSEEARQPAARQLEALVRKQFVRPIRVSGEREAFRFAHVLIQQAAYRSIPKKLRVDLHERFAAWLSETTDAWVGELDEIIGYHLEQAFRYHEELGSVDSHARALANRASDLLASAARRAGARGDDRAAANLLRRARGLLSPEDPRLPPLGVALADALSMVGDLEEAEDLYRGTIRMAAARGDRRTEWLATVEHVALKAHLEPASWNADEVRRTAQQALAVFEDLGDHVGLARAWKLLGYVDWYLCRFEPVAKAYERGLVHARRSGDERTRRHLTGSLSAALYYGPTPAPEAIARISELLAEEGGRALEADGLVQLAGLHTMQGHFEEGRTLYEQAKAIRWELGLKRGVATATMHAREIHLLGGDADGAVRELLWGYETLEQIGEKAGRSTVAADLAEALYRQGRYEEADHFAHVALEAASPEDVASQVMGRVVSAKLLAVKRMHDDAEETAREAVALAETTDDLFTLGHAYEALAEVLLLANRREEAIAALQAAAEASERKGNLVTAENARGRIESLRPSPRSDVLGNRTH